MNLLQFGRGNWGKNHHRILSAMPGMVLELAELSTWPGSLDSIADYDGVLITCTSVNHYPVLRECLQAGVPVFCEKPICLTPNQLQELNDLYTGSIFMAGHQLTFMDFGLNGTSEILKPLSITSLRTGSVIREEGCVLSLMVHDLAVAQYLTGTKSFSIRQVAGDLHNCKVGLATDEDVYLDFLCQSVSAIRLRHMTITGLRQGINQVVTQVLTPDNWNRLDLLALELTEFTKAVAERRQPDRSGWPQTKIVMDAVFNIRGQLK